MFVVTFASDADFSEPFDALRDRETVEIGRDVFGRLEWDVAKCVAAEGELPFVFDGAYDAPLVDLQGFGKTFATLDYSDSPNKPRVYLGEYVSLDDLHLEGRPEAAASSERVVVCPSCHNEIPIHGLHTVFVVCKACESGIDLASEKGHAARGKFPAWRSDLDIALNSVGVFGGLPYQVLGFQRRCVHVEGVGYRWDEYVLFNPDVGFRWLTQYEGHWNWVRPALGYPVRKGMDRE